MNPEAKHLLDCAATALHDLRVLGEHLTEARQLAAQHGFTAWACHLGAADYGLRQSAQHLAELMVPPYPLSASSGPSVPSV